MYNIWHDLGVQGIQGSQVHPKVPRRGPRSHKEA